MVQDRAIVSTEDSDQYKVDRHHFQWPWATANPNFQITPILDVEYGINGTR